MRLAATDVKATYRPSSEIAASPLAPLAWPSASVTDTRSTVWDHRSLTNTSTALLVSFVTRLVALDSNTTKRPLPLMTG